MVEGPDFDAWRARERPASPAAAAGPILPASFVRSKKVCETVWKTSLPDLAAAQEFSLARAEPRRGATMRSWSTAALLTASLFTAILAAQSPASGPAFGPSQTPNTDINADNAPLVGPGDWRMGRATFYDAPAYFQEAFASRGEGAFGSVLYGDCQYYSRGLGEQKVTYANQAVPKDMIAALASADPDYPGSCGRCYELQCRDGLVIEEGTTPVRDSNGYDLQAIAPQTKDTYGRSFPGNPARDEDENFVRCWNNTESIYVEITDTCPCHSETANNTQWCCGPVQHFDLSFWAFEKLAHPLYGTMMLNFRPVDCATKQPFAGFLPGFINETIYGDRVEAGWSFNVYEADQYQFALAGAGVDGSNATCLQLRGQGGVSFTARNASDPGYQPFAKANTLKVAARNNGTSGLPQNIKLQLQNTEQKLYCGGDVVLGQTVQPSRTSGDYSLFNIPLSQFQCNSLAQIDGLGVQNTGSVTQAFCLDDIALVGGSSSATATAGRKLS